MHIYLKNTVIEDENEDDVGYHIYRFALVVLVLDIECLGT